MARVSEERTRPVTAPLPFPRAGSTPGGPHRPQDHFTLSAFARLARTHAASAASDAMVATALAGTIFFEGATSDARSKVFFYLLLTMAPFALVAPLIGPALDRARSGRRWVVVGTAVVRSAMCFLMIGHLDDLYFYPEAFVVLVMQKGYGVARAALVPNTVSSDDALVEANSKLSLISGVMGFVGAAPAALLFAIGGPAWALGLAMVGYVVTAIVALRISSDPIAEAPPDEVERQELRSVGVLLAASAMGLIRGIVGFLTVLLAFDFRGDDAPKWHFAMVAAGAVLGGLAGAAVAPRLRRLATEERMLIGTLLTITGAAGVAVVLGGWLGATLLAWVVGVGSVSGKQAFDSIVQRDAPDANRGRSFARFETRFQIIWVVGALFGLIPWLDARTGFVVVMVVAAFAAFSYGVGSLAWKHRTGESRTTATQWAHQTDTMITEAKAKGRQRVSQWVATVRARARDRQSRRGRMSRVDDGPGDDVTAVHPGEPSLTDPGAYPPGWAPTQASPQATPAPAPPGSHPADPPAP